MNLFGVDPNTMVYVKWINMTIIFLILLGGLNWLSIGLLGIDAVRLGLAPRHAKWVYTIIGIAALLLALVGTPIFPSLERPLFLGGP
jgi:uncharacterized membrane protein YuzA (DUF378 family)